MKFPKLLSKLYPGTQFEGNDPIRVIPCPICGSEKTKPCVIFKNDTIYCHDTGCALNDKALRPEEFLILTGNKKEIPGGDGMKSIAKSGGNQMKNTIDRNLQRNIWQDAVDFFHKNLMQTQTALDYQTKERKHDLKTLKAFGVGYYDDEDALLKYLSGRGYKLKEIAQSGLFDEKSESIIPDDSYTYPILIDGELRNIKFKYDGGGGYLKKEYAGDDYPLCINSDVIQTSNEIYLVEGENDLLSMYEAKHENTIATLGGIKTKHIEYLRTLKEKKILILAFDNDDAGKKSNLRAQKSLEGKHIIKLAEYDGKDPDECLKKGNGKIIAIDPEKFIRNYVMDIGGNGRTFYEYIKTITDDMKKPIRDFYCFENSEGKRILYSEINNREIPKPDVLYVALLKSGYVMDFMASGVSEGKWLEYIREDAKTYDRFSELYEIDPDQQTRYLSPHIEGEKSGVFRDFMRTFTVESPKDEYRLAAGFLSAFINREFDGDKPLFSLIANNPSSGKTYAVRWGARIIQGTYPIDLDGVREDEEAIGSHLMMANKFALYDNIEFPTGKQFTTMEKALTNKNIKSWIMHVTHGYVPNNKTYFATFNNDQALRRDLLERALIVRMQDGRDVPYKRKIKASNGLELCYENRKYILQDIYAHFDQVNWDQEVPYISHPKFTKWSKEMAKILHVFYPKIEKFDFSLSEMDREIDIDQAVLKEMLLDILKNDEEVFISNLDLLAEFKNHFGERHPYADNTTAMSRKLKGMGKSIIGIELKKTKKKYENKEYRGWLIRKFSNDNNKDGKKQINQKAHESNPSQIDLADSSKSSDPEINHEEIIKKYKLQNVLGKSN